MNEGLLWYDDDPGRGLADKVARAVGRYRQKFGVSPDVVYVHPSTLDGSSEARKMDGVRMVSRPSVLRHHFWIGQEKEQQRCRGQQRALTRAREEADDDSHP